MNLKCETLHKTLRKLKISEPRIEKECGRDMQEDKVSKYQMHFVSVEGKLRVRGVGESVSSGIPA